MKNKSTMIIITNISPKILRSPNKDIEKLADD